MALHLAYPRFKSTLLQRRTLELTGKSRKKGAVQSELARICNVPHKNFFIVVKVSQPNNMLWQLAHPHAGAIAHAYVLATDFKQYLYTDSAILQATHAVGHDLCAKPRTKLVLQTLETHSLVVRNNIQIRGDSGRVQTSILHLTRFAPDLAPGLKFAVCPFVWFCTLCKFAHCLQHGA